MAAPTGAPPPAAAPPSPPPGVLPFFRVSSRGVANGRSPQPNHGFPFGPDTPNTQTGGIQEALQRAQVLGGAVVELDPFSTYDLQAPLILRSGVWLHGNSATLRNGAELPVIAETAPNMVTRNLHVTGLTLDGQNAGQGFGMEVHALQWSDLEVRVMNAPHGVRLLANPQAAGADPLLHGNICFNRFRFLLDRIRGTGVHLQGASPTAVVTDNTFTDIFGVRIGGTGVDLAEWADSNAFGHLLLSMGGNGGTGLVLNSVGAAENHGVYNNLFGKVSVDAFGVQGVTAMRLFNSKMNVVHQLYTSPEGRDFPGRILDDRGAESYDILSTGESRHYVRGFSTTG